MPAELITTSCSHQPPATHHPSPPPCPQTWSNLADALVQQAELLCSAGGRAEGEAMFSRALQAYEHSCALSDSSNGDDLPGLLYNWGVGLQAVSKHAQVGRCRWPASRQAQVARCSHMCGSV